MMQFCNRIEISCRGHNSLRPRPNCVLLRGRNELWPLQLNHHNYIAKLHYLVLLICFLLISLSACSTDPSTINVHPQSTAPLPVQHPSPTPTNPPPGIVLYQADWSHGFKGWQGTSGWKIVQGQLETDASGSGVFTIPYKPLVPNYVLEIRVQVVRLSKPIGGYFFITAPRLPGKDGYTAGVTNFVGSATRPNGSHPAAQVFLASSAAPVPGTGRPIDYEPGSAWHTYRVEVMDNQVSLLADDVSMVSVSSSQTDTLSNGPIMFESDLLILHISSLRILTL